MKRSFNLEGFTLTELLVTMTLFALVMAVVTTVVVIQLRMVERLSRGSQKRDLFWYHLERISLQTVRWGLLTNGWRFETADRRTYEIQANPLLLREVGGMVWHYPFEASITMTTITNHGRVVLVTRLAGISFDETRQFALGWQKGPKP